MEYSFASRRQLSFIIGANGTNLLVQFGSRNQAGVSVFMTSDPAVAHAVRRHPLTRRGIIEETTVEQTAEEPVGTVEKETNAAEATPVTETDETTQTEVVEPGTTEGQATAKQAEAKEKMYDNYTVARESICKEFGIKKELVRNPTALGKVALEHGIIIKYKEL